MLKHRREEFARAIFEKLAEGRTLTSILAEPGLPCETTVRRWVATDATLRAAFIEARQKAIAQKFG